MHGCLKFLFLDKKFTIEMHVKKIQGYDRLDHIVQKRIKKKINKTYKIVKLRE